MLVSLRWLKDYIDIRISLAELVDQLTMAGLEVEAVKEIGTLFRNVVVAKIISLRPHPSADNCFLCDVTTGENIFPVV
jgi:phenylalanyl-tRNA synthetase beta chain